MTRRSHRPRSCLRASVIRSPLALIGACARRHDLARTGSRVRDAQYPPVRSRCCAVWTTALLAMDRRSRCGHLPTRLPARHLRISYTRRLLSASHHRGVVRHPAASMPTLTSQAGLLSQSSLRQLRPIAIIGERPLTIEGVWKHTWNRNRRTACALLDALERVSAKSATTKHS
jgi:hypothetical protein